MKSLAVAILLVGSSIASTALAAKQQYTMKMDYSYKGQNIMGEEFTLEEGKKSTSIAQIPEGFLYVERTARNVKKDGQDMILVDITVGTKDRNGGDYKLISQPRLIVKNNLPATMTLSDEENGKLYLKAEVTKK